MRPDLDLPPSRPYRWRAKAGDVAGNLALAALAAALTAVAFVVGRDTPMLRVLGAYTAFGALATVVLAGAMALTRRLPGLRRADLDREPALVARAWPGEWWHTLALDCGLVVVAAALVAMAASDTELLVLTLPVAAVGLWFLGRLVLTAAGFRRREALWLTGTEVVHDAAWGRERVPRTAITRVRASTLPGGTTVVLEVGRTGAADSTGRDNGQHPGRPTDSESPLTRQVCPRPWRRGGPRPGRLVVDCALIGPAPADVAAWLDRQLAGERSPHRPPGARRHR